ncbi:hypothetical protein BIU88_07110 [Chlorobaculum limnaeum]|uniref:Tetratricopeptide repeat protein n=2 Tax=Chlorobaculum limnaeum TaxID=274537 RepID=A0A1D8CYC8_CHLLM|nr:hypothetical protein BIU88_07110 [Chlorobaculum limnaeum]
MGVHPGAIKRLLEQDLYPYQDMHETQQKILRRIIQKYPNDAFIDHAYYFLHNYSIIIKNYSHSFIKEEAYYSKAYRYYYLNVREPILLLQYELYIGKISKKEMDQKLFMLQPKIKNAISEYNEFIDQYKKSNLLKTAFRDLTRTVGYEASIDDAMKGVNNVYNKVKEVENRVDKKTYSFIIMAVSGAVKEFFNERIPYYDTDSRFKQLPKEIQQNIDINELYLYGARQAFSQKKYVASLGIYKKVQDNKKNLFYDRENLRIRGLEKYVVLLKKYTEKKISQQEYFFRSGLAFKGMIYDADHAVVFFDKYKMASSSIDYPKIELLKAFCYRNSSKGEMMRNTLVGLYNQYPNHPLADDVLAEIGLYYLLWIGDYDAAINTFDKVVYRYPDGNAADNALNWKAYALMQKNDPVKAFYAYMDVVKKVPFSRFAEYAFNNIVKILYLTKSDDFSPILSYLNSVGKYCDAGYANIEERPVVFYADKSGKFVKLKIEFNDYTQISDFEYLRPENVVVFKAEDYEYIVNYAWDVYSDKYIFVSREKKQGL